MNSMCGGIETFYLSFTQRIFYNWGGLSHQPQNVREGAIRAPYI